MEKNVKKIYAYYGVLAHEKQPMYRAHHIKDEICEELYVDLTGYKTWETAIGEIGITISGKDYLLDEVLTNDGDKPALRWCDGHYTHKKVLDVVKG